MSTPNKYDPSSNIPTPPCCPHCGKGLDGLGCYQWSMQIATGLVQILAMHCPNDGCRKIIGSPVMAVVAGAQAEQSRIQA